MKKVVKGKYIWEEGKWRKRDAWVREEEKINRKSRLAFLQHFLLDWGGEQLDKDTNLCAKKYFFLMDMPLRREGVKGLTLKKNIFLTWKKKKKSSDGP